MLQTLKNVIIFVAILVTMILQETNNLLQEYKKYYEGENDGKM